MENETCEQGLEKIPAKNKWTVIILIVLVAIVGLAYFSLKSGKSDSSGSGSSGKVDVRVDISGIPFEFSVKEIRVKKGDRVRIDFTSVQGMHDWVVDEFSARTKQLTAGQSDSVEFVADKKGTFEYYCSVPTHKQAGMVGKLIVE